MVPKGWSQKLISDVGAVVTGNTPPTSNPEYYNGKYPFVSPADLGAHKLINSSIKSLSSQGMEKARSVRAGATLFTCIGSTIGKIGLAGCTLATNQQINVVIPKPDYDDDYVYYQLELRAAYIAKLAGTQAVPIINKTTFESQCILVPDSLPEQNKIAKILSTWDKAISTTEQLLANSQQQKKSLMQQLLTGKKRLLDNNGVGFSGEWKSYHLSHVTVIVMGSSPKSEAYNENGVGLPLLQGNADIKNRISAPRVFTSEITKECEIGDILLSVRAPVGTVAISEHKACIGRGIAALHAKPNFDQSFIYQFLLWFEPKWGSLSQGSTFESINSDDIKNLKIKVPNFGEQQKIAAVLTTADQEITTLQQKLDALKQEKQALMQQLLTGKRRVKVEEAA
ncbi:restriction endonuclease subunit S [Aeromonas caviae]|jgi:type I restriction enzyme S subunit|uniref:Restriction endonuclease subunit S n=1 Tax=Aeromonas caviae TaxID=648 RepID=A0ABU5W4I7_AERCA|nr:restriction endonuclease subunit S [Aeromonas caviae]MEA9424390.1 restriction endonuclease subunit S [Aeromonas caviae]MEA9435806.1 restriction endonuclease subunit S [Aeromonas caviae]